MRERILEFVDRLRAHDLAISPAETMDAMAAVGAAFSFFLVGVVGGGGLNYAEDEYSDGVIKAGVIATLFWGAVAMATTALIGHLFGSVA